MAHVLCMLATDTRLECLILIAFPRQQRLRERASMLRYTYIACLCLFQFFINCSNNEALFHMSYVCQSGIPYTSDRCFHYGSDWANCAHLLLGNPPQGTAYFFAWCGKSPLPSLSSPFTNHTKIFLFPPLPIIGPYNAHRNPISYTFWKLHLVWPVPSPGCMVCLLLYYYFCPHSFWFLAQVCPQNITLSPIGLSKTLIWIYSFTFILRSRIYWFACYTKSTHNIQMVLLLWNNF